MTDIITRLGLAEDAGAEEIQQRIWEAHDDCFHGMRCADCILNVGKDECLTHSGLHRLLTAIEQRGYRRGIEEAADIVEEMICGDYDKEEDNKLKRGVPYCYDVPRVIRELLRAGEEER